MFPKNFNCVKLTVDKNYLISNGEKIREVKFIRVTERGFNLIDSTSGKKLFKYNMYPMELNRNEKTLTFWIPQYLTIDKKQ